MKRLPYILLLSVLMVVVTTCKKRPELKIYKLELTEETVSVSPYSATIRANYSYQGEIPQIKVYTSTNSSMYDAIETDAVLDNNTLIATIDNLSSDTKYLYYFKYSNGINLINTDVRNFTTEHAVVAPTVVTIPITSVTSSSAISGGTVTDNGGADILEKGVCWSTSQNPTIADSHTSDGTGSGAYVSALTDLLPNTLYYVRSYATNSETTGYGNELSFTTSSSLASITTKSITNITPTSANGGGVITNGGGGDITARGVCWSTLQNPTISDSCTIDGTGVGEFTSLITGLTNDVTYYVRAYATNINGTSYGEERSFTTQDGQAVLTTNEVTNIITTSATCGGEITDDGGYNITARGVCWSTNQNPTVSDSHTSNGTGIGTFTSNITGLTDNTTYYVRAYATNSKGTSYGEEKTFTTIQNTTLPTVITYQVTDIGATTATSGGYIIEDGGSTVTDRGVCWSTEHNPTLNINYMTHDGSGTGEFVSSITGLSPNTIYYVRAYATNSVGTNYGEEKSFTTNDGLPVVTTAEVSDITQTTAVCGGNVTSDGGLTVTSRGVCWSTSPNPVLNVNYMTSNGSGTGAFTSNISSLSPNTTYYVRAYASNSAGTSYGEQKMFTTLSNGSGTVPTGAINGLFSVSSTQQVYFSQGNLQYQASTNTWRFAINQYDYIGNDNSSISSTYSGWIDLFGWGTSGCNHGAVCYQPWSTSMTDSDYYAYGDLNLNLNNQSGQADWGYNAISNGNNTTNCWRTLTRDEWVYLFNTRATTSGIRYAKAKVNNINGVIILPDNWSTSIYSLTNTNESGANYNTNVIDLADWNTLENAGVVFLPAAGIRDGTHVPNTVGSYGYYWSSTSNGSSNAYTLDFSYNYNISAGSVGPSTQYDRYNGISVRLVYATTAYER